MVCLSFFARLIEFVRYFLLFIFDLLQALAGILNIRRSHNGVTTGLYCTAQGLVAQIGEVGVALITLVYLVS